MLFRSVGINYDEDFATLHPAMEIGARASFFNNMDSKFCFNSVSLGALTDFEGVYMTVGASLSLSLIFMSLFLL